MATADKLAKFMSKMQGATGVNSLWLERAAKSGLLNLDTATPDDVYRVASQLQGAKPSSAARQLELPLGPEAAEPDIRKLLPRAPEAPAIRPRPANPNAPMYDASGMPQAARIETLFPADKPLPISSPQPAAPARIAAQFDRAVGAGKPDYGPWKEAAGAVAGAGLVGAAAQTIKNGSVAKAPEPEGITSTDGTADLANESRPAPAVAPSEDDEKAFTETFKRQYTARENKRKAKGAGTYPKPQQAPQQPDPREQAQVLIADLNERRRKAGGEVADAQQTMAKINSLLAQSDKIRNSRTANEAGSYAKSNPNDYHAQASAMIADLNERAKAMGGTPPDMQQTLAEVRRLQALGDQQRNAAQTRRY